MGSKILIVEDDRTLVNALKHNPVKKYYSVIIAVDGIQAPELA
jgi:DNA-binding response OmpR family regulator